LFGDEAAYAKVLEELQRTGPIPALWAKAFAETNGDEKASKALYFRLRVRAGLEAATHRRRSGQRGGAPCGPRAPGPVRRAPGATWLYVVIGFFVIVTALSGILASMYL
jgi:hypothetical protein